MYRLVPTSGNRGQWFCGLTVGLCGFISGLGMSWTSVFFPKLNSGEVGVTFTATEQSFIASVAHVGQLCATFPSGYIQDKVGRRCTLLIFIQFLLVAWVLIYVSRTFWSIIVARFIIGFWTSISLTCCSAYTGEIATPSIRGRLSASLSLLYQLGLLYQTSVGSYISYDAIAITSFALTFAHLIILMNVPESVYSLLRFGRDEQAEKNLRWLRGKADVHEDFLHIKHHLNEQMARKTSFKELFKGEASRKAFVQALSLMLVQRCSGFLPFVSFSSQIFPEDWNILESEKYPMVWNAVNVSFFFFSVCIIDFVDRKVILLISMIGCVVFGAIVTVWFFLYEKTSIDMTGTIWIPYVAVSIHAAFFSSGYFFIPIVFLGEIFPMNVKSKGTCLVVFISYFPSFIIVQMFLPMKHYLGMYGNFVVYTISSIIGCFVCTKMTETRKRSLELIQYKLVGVKSEEYRGMKNRERKVTRSSLLKK